MTQVMKGIRVLEVAPFTFVPAAGAILANRGADAIKIEHPLDMSLLSTAWWAAGTAVDPAGAIA